MRSAIRGDFERLAERRGEQELMRVPEREPDLEPTADEIHDESPSRSWIARLIAGSSNSGDGESRA